ncbi:hypothetical protein LY90DRAFT_504254 [Neocallimastix californiae]|uniref:Sphingomyelin phosphodiesterase n=1 Tax=Neocallimastix californiae TaxID=1754190 RepID=A0A1Y2EC80_9FUNG|nr:hypothetical protein LY90DRAFT_504254 [Neocallimastix californiae]|eukprot:ORY69180.1 hypothetical protein LY90DRAFT_504254 [Neocallimastix californiae]
MYYFLNSYRLACKGALYVRLKVGNNKHINIFSTHLQASYENYPPPDSKSVKVRMNQALILHKFIYKNMKNHISEPCFVMGDFNVDGVRQPEEIENKGWYTDKAKLNDHDLDVYAHSNEYIALVNLLRGNLDGVPEEYMPKDVPETPLLGTNDITTRFNIHNLIYNHQDPKVHPITTSNFRGVKGPFEEKSLDYIFEFTPIGTENREDNCNTPVNDNIYPNNETIDNSQTTTPTPNNNNNNEFINKNDNYNICSAKVEPYEVDNPNFKYISDHFSVTTTVQM